MTSPKSEKIKNYLKLLEKFETEIQSYSNLFHPDFIQTEYPNSLNKKGQKSSLAELYKRMETGKMILSSQTYEIQSIIEQEDKVAIEATWQGVMAMDAGALKSGQKLVAHFCMIFEFKDNLIYRQKNYDCFEPF